MKKFILFCASFALLAGSAGTTMAEGIASPSLSSLRSFDNPAVQGLGKEGYKVGALQRNMTYNPLGVSSTETKNEYLFQQNMESFFYSLGGESSPDGDGSWLSMGWSWNYFALAAYTGNYTPAGQAQVSLNGAGYSWRIGSSMYLGAVLDNYSSGASTQSLGFGIRLANNFRAEGGSIVQDNGAGLTSSETYSELEFRWGNVVLGIYNKNDANLEKTTFISWEPEKEGLTFFLSDVSSSAADFQAGTQIGVGYNF